MKKRRNPQSTPSQRRDWATGKAFEVVVLFSVAQLSASIAFDKAGTNTMLAVPTRCGVAGITKYSAMKAL